MGLTGLAIAFGYTTAAYMGLAFSYYNNPTAQWRAPLAIAIVFPLVLLIALCFTPESPRYLLLKDKSDQALEILRKIHRTRADPDEEYIKEEFFQMRKQIEYDRTLDSSWRVLFTRPSYRKRLYMSCGTIFLAQSTGVLVAAAYVSFYLSRTHAQTLMLYNEGTNSLRCSGVRVEGSNHSTMRLDYWYIVLFDEHHRHALILCFRIYTGSNRRNQFNGQIWSQTIYCDRINRLHHRSVL